MRARLVAAGIALVVLAQSTAHALWLGVPEFPQIVQEADICVYGRITSARVIGEGVDRDHDSYECVAELFVDQVVFGPCKVSERIAVFYGEWIVDDTVFAPARSYVALLAKRPAPLKGYRSHALHLGVLHIARDGTVHIPEGLENPPKLREPTNFQELFEQIRYLRGPEVAIRPTKPSFRWDEPVTLEATFRNPCFETQMKLLFAPPPLAEYSYADQYLSAEGLPICDPGVPRPAEDPKPVAVVLAPYDSTTRSVTVHPHFRERADYDLASIAQIAVEYATGCVQEVEGAWTGSAFSAPAPIRIARDENAFTRKLADVGRRHAFTLGVHEKRLKPGQPARITVTAAYPASAARPEILVKSSFEWGGYRTLRQTDECLAALAGQCEVIRDGRRIETAHEARRGVGWLRILLKSDHSPTHGWTRLGVELDLGKHFDLTQPGHYTVRLVVPREEIGEARALASNLAEFEITAKEGAAAPAESKEESTSGRHPTEARETLTVPELTRHALFCELTTEVLIQRVFHLGHSGKDIGDFGRTRDQAIRRMTRAMAGAEDPDVRRVAALKLALLCGQDGRDRDEFTSAADALRALLNRRKEMAWVRLAAARGLAYMGLRDGVPFLRQVASGGLVHSSSGFERDASAWALLALGERLPEGERRYVRFPVLNRLAAAGGADGPEGAEIKAMLIRQVFTWDMRIDSASHRLVSLRDTGKDVADFGRTWKQSFRNAMRALAEGEDLPTRQVAAQSLAHWAARGERYRSQAARAAKLLRKVLGSEDENGWLRLDAARALAYAGHRDGVPFLRRVAAEGLGSTLDLERDKAAWALLALGEPLPKGERPYRLPLLNRVAGEQENEAGTDGR